MKRDVRLEVKVMYLPTGSKKLVPVTKTITIRESEIEGMTQEEREGVYVLRADEVSNEFLARGEVRSVKWSVL